MHLQPHTHSFGFSLASLSSIGAECIRTWLMDMRAEEASYLRKSAKYATLLFSIPALFKRSEEHPEQRYILTAIKGPLSDAELRACQEGLAPLGIYLARAADYVFGVCNLPGQRRRCPVAVRAFPRCAPPMDGHYWSTCTNPFKPDSLLLASFTLVDGFESVDRTAKHGAWGGRSFKLFVESTVRPPSSTPSEAARLKLPHEYEEPGWNQSAYVTKAQAALALQLLARQADALLARLPVGRLEGVGFEHCQVIAGYVRQGLRAYLIHVEVQCICLSPTDSTDFD